MTKNTANKTASYIKSGILLHLITLTELVLFFILFRVLNIEEWLNKGNWFLKFIALLPFISMPVFAQLDARSRFQNYKLIKDSLFFYGFQPRIMNLFIKSRCQRDAAMVAAQETSMKKLCKDFFRASGYRWYHLFPDIVFYKPIVLLKKDFWITTLFAKTYRSKIDFKKMRKIDEKNKKPSFKMAANILSGITK